MKVLRIDSSAQKENAISRKLVDTVVSHLPEESSVNERDLNDALPQLDENWIIANNTPEAERNLMQQSQLMLSDVLIDEIESADLLVIGVPVYNFSIPASLKLWIDQICRAGKTFSYGEDGPKGLLENKRAIICFASGGTQFGSYIDYASSYMRHILSFIGITEVEFIVADSHYSDESVLEKAEKQAEQLVLSLIQPSTDVA